LRPVHRSHHQTAKEVAARISVVVRVRFHRYQRKPPSLRNPKQRIRYQSLATYLLNNERDNESADSQTDRFGLVHPVISKGFAMVLGIIVAAGSLTLIGSSSSGASSTSPSNLRCGSDQLSVTWRGTTGGLAGTFGELFWIRNNGALPCVVSGFPSVVLSSRGRKFPMKTEDLEGHKYNDQMGVAPRRRIPSIRLLSGELASFWVFGNDVVTKCINADEMVVSMRSLTGSASIPVPRNYQSWMYCGNWLEVNPLVPGVSGSYPSRPLSSEIMR
jgi:hypothetical protein